MLSSLYVHHFRNYREAEFSFSPGVNWLVGRNGEGKTNVIEALLFLASGRSFRTPHLSQLIERGEAFFFLEAKFQKEGLEQTIRLSFDGETKKVEANGKTYAHFTPLIGLLPHVLYCPEDIGLISGPPANRRRLLNLHLAQSDPLYVYHLGRYHRALCQRNHLLKVGKREGIEAWEVMLATSGVYLVKKRRELVERLGPALRETLFWLTSEEEEVQMVYQASLSIEEEVASFAKELAKTRDKEMRFKTTLSGPHRDDLHFSLGKASAKAFASEGQKHSIIASLRLAQLDDLKESSPFFSIDDFGAHLDKKRRERLREKIGLLPQVFLTSPDVVTGEFAPVTIIDVGRYTRCLK